jgi:N-succinyldiaminopimelate aminotransferase
VKRIAGALVDSSAPSPKGGDVARPFLNDSLAPFGTTIFSEMTRLALEHGAVNLAQGFPDFDGPAELVEEVCQALRRGDNQYARSMGHPLLVSALARRQRALYDLSYEPMSEVVVTSGATETIAAAILGLLRAGDEVILFEPFYDSYQACLAMAGARPRLLTLRFPDFAVDLDELAALVTPATRAIVLNSPHNPTGRVFSRAELEGIAALARRHDLWVISDEVYEHLTYDGHRHVPIATLQGMRERTLTISSAGKTFSVTGWKVGWAFGPAAMVGAVQAAHQFLTFATATPMQVGLARFLDGLAPTFYAELAAQFAARRDALAAVLREVGFDVAASHGTYFLIAGFHQLSQRPDREFAEELIQRVGVAAIPPSVFYTARPDEGRRLLRFAFCKRAETLELAATRLRGLARGAPPPQAR